MAAAAVLCFAVLCRAVPSFQVGAFEVVQEHGMMRSSAHWNLSQPSCRLADAGLGDCNLPVLEHLALVALGTAEEAWMDSLPVAQLTALELAGVELPGGGSLQALGARLAQVWEAGRHMCCLRLVLCCAPPCCAARRHAVLCCADAMWLRASWAVC